MPHVSKRGLGHNIRVTSYLPVLFPVLIEFFPALFLADRIGCGSTMLLMKATLADNLHRRYFRCLHRALEYIQI